MIDLRLINYRHPIQDDALILKAYSEKYPLITLEKNTLDALNKLLKHINGQELIFPISGYRSPLEQAQIIKDSVIENGVAYTKAYVAMPHHSEHQSGLAIDLSTDCSETDIIAPKFDYETEIGSSFKQAMTKFGFILRYPEDKEDITKVKYEPWHFRFVGYPHSEIITNNQQVLEEYLDWIKQFTKDHPLQYQNYEIFYNSEPLPLKDYTSSFNNVDGYIYTKEKK